MFLIRILTEFEVAHGTFAKRDGMVIDIINDKAATPLFNCRFWSDFTDENERFFIGSLIHFDFVTIHHISVQKDYAVFIRPMNILANMIMGFPFNQSAIKSIDVSIVSLLILDYISDSFSSEVAVYIHRFFGNFAQNVNKVPNTYAQIQR